MKEALKLALKALEHSHANEPIWKTPHREAITAIKEVLAQPEQPVQEPQYEYLIDDLADWKQYVQVDNAPYGLREHITKVLLSHGIKGLK